MHGMIIAIQRDYKTKAAFRRCLEDSSSQKFYKTLKKSPTVDSYSKHLCRDLLYDGVAAMQFATSLKTNFIPSVLLWILWFLSL